MVNPKTLTRKRKGRGLTQEELAQRVKLTVSTIARLEQGRDSNPRLGTLRKIASALNCRVADLLAD
jgi:transcriptional regulator with XRE-family HTH domain